MSVVRTAAGRLALVLALALATTAISTTAIAGAEAAGPAAPARPAAEAHVQAGRNRAAVVVDLGGGDVRTACVSFDASTISGVEALRLAGFDPVTQAFGGRGTAVCALCGQGCSAGSGCLTCQQPKYWGYWPGYRYSSAGAGATRVGNGDVEAWRWGTGAAPTRVSYSKICVPVPPSTTTTTRPPPPPPPPRAGPSAPTSPGGAGPTSSAPAATTAPSASEPTMGSASTTTTQTSGSTTSAPRGAAGDQERADEVAEDSEVAGGGRRNRSEPSGEGDGGGSAVPSAIGFSAALTGVGLLILRARHRRAGSR